jgi:hypothetical protein
MHPSDWILQRHNPSILLRKSKFRYTRGIEHRSKKSFGKGVRQIRRDAFYVLLRRHNDYENGIEFN